MAGSSVKAFLKAAISRIELVAPTGANVLILESPDRKELIAVKSTPKVRAKTAP